MKKKIQEPEENEGAKVSTVTRFEGTPEEVARAQRKMAATEPADTPPEIKDKDDKFFETLQFTEGFRVIAQRRVPTEINGRELKNLASIGETPLDMFDVESTIKEKYGGSLWALSIYDPRTNRKVAGKTLEIMDPPKPIFEEGEEEEVPPYNYPTREQMAEEEINPEKLIKKQIQFQQLQMMLNELKGNKGDNGVQTAIAQAVQQMTNNFNTLMASFKSEVDNRIRRIEDDQKEKKHEEELKQMKHGQEIDKLMAQNRETINQVRQELGNKLESSIERLSHKVEEANKRSPEQEVLMTKLFDIMHKATDNKVDSMAESQKNILTIMQANQQGNANMVKDLINQMSQRTDTLESLQKLLDVVGGARGMLGMDGVREPLDFGSRVMSTIEKMGPEILRYLSDKDNKAEEEAEVSRKDLAEQIVSSLRTDIATQVREQVKPKPQLNPPSQPIKKEGEVMPDDAVEKSIKARVDNTMTLLLQEVKIRPRNPEWIGYAMDKLPEELIEQLSRSTTQDEVLNLLKKYVSPKLMGLFIGQLAIDPKGREWVKYCFELLIHIARGDEPDGEAEIPEPTDQGAGDGQ